MFSLDLLDEQQNNNQKLTNKMDKLNVIPGFIMKLWKMINDRQCDDIISWSENGQSFIISDPPRFSQELSKYFKHNNLSSFIRQLNMYGFRKVATIENSGLNPGSDDLHFYHPDFIKGQPERLEAIKRKLPQKLAEGVDLRNVYKGISEIEDKQKNVSKTLNDIKRENEMLWAELHDLRQKHQQQQLYISRLMKLVFEAMEQNGIKTNMLKLQRNSPLMIEGGSIGSTSPTGDITVTSAPSPTTIGSSVDNITTAGGTITSTGVVVDPTAIGDPTAAVDPTTAASPASVAGTTTTIATNDPTVSEPVIHNPIDDQFLMQVDTADYQIDALVPTIGDFSEEDINFFADNDQGLGPC